VAEVTFDELVDMPTPAGMIGIPSRATPLMVDVRLHEPVRRPTSAPMA
jgi:hypothetical protein